MIARYTNPAMGRIWSDQRRFETWLEVEIAAAEAMADRGIIPAEAARAIRERGAVDAARVEAIEAVTKHDLVAFTTAVAERVGLGPQLDRLAGALSHGEQRQLEVGLALALRPQLLLLDEPMAGMGPDESERMVALLQSLRGEATMLLVEHDMDAVFRLADRISTLVFGRVIATGTPAEIRENADVRRAYLGDEAEMGA